MRLNNFDLLRLFAATQVLIFHAIERLQLPPPLHELTWLINAFPGVPIFFAISGFLISASFERSSSLQSYARKRALRIFPALWICILLTVIAATAFGTDFLQLKAVIWALAQSFGLIYTPGFMQDFGIGSYNGSLWTIPVELQFYVLIPIVYWLIRKRGRPICVWFCLWLIFLAIALLAQIYAPVLEPGTAEPIATKLLRYSFVPHFYMFVTGVLLRLLAVNEMSMVRGKGFYWIVGYLVFAWIMPDSDVVHIAKLLLLCIVTVSVAFSWTSVSERLLRGHDVSYGVYIYHGLLLNVLIELGFAGQISGFWLAFVGTVVLSGLSWLIVEQPFLRQKSAPTPQTDIDLSDGVAAQAGSG